MNFPKGSEVGKGQRIKAGKEAFGCVRRRGPTVVDGLEGRGTKARRAIVHHEGHEET